VGGDVDGVSCGNVRAPIIWMTSIRGCLFAYDVGISSSTGTGLQKGIE
jgi:hypothetical protein